MPWNMYKRWKASNVILLQLIIETLKGYKEEKTTIYLLR